MSNRITSLPQSPPRVSSDSIIFRFPARLWRIVNSCKTGAITWGPSGRSVRVNRVKFVNEYLKTESKPFKTVHFTSFIRQLNLYGFRKIAAPIIMIGEDEDSGCLYEYRHPLFRQGHPELLPYIQRNCKRKSENTARVAYATAVPDSTEDLCQDCQDCQDETNYSPHISDGLNINNSGQYFQSGCQHQTGQTAVTGTLKPNSTVTTLQPITVKTSALNQSSCNLFEIPSAKSKRVSAPLVTVNQITPVQSSYGSQQNLVKGSQPLPHVSQAFSQGLQIVTSNELTREYESHSSNKFTPPEMFLINQALVNSSTLPSLISPTPVNITTNPSTYSSLQVPNLSLINSKTVSPNPFELLPLSTDQHPTANLCGFLPLMPNMVTVNAGHIDGVNAASSISLSLTNPLILNSNETFQLQQTPVVGAKPGLNYSVSLLDHSFKLTSDLLKKIKGQNETVEEGTQTSDDKITSSVQQEPPFCLLQDDLFEIGDSNLSNPGGIVLFQSESIANKNISCILNRKSSFKSQGVKCNNRKDSRAERSRAGFTLSKIIPAPKSEIAQDFISSTTDFDSTIDEIGESSISAGTVVNISLPVEKLDKSVLALLGTQSISNMDKASLVLQTSPRKGISGYIFVPCSTSGECYSEK